MIQEIINFLNTYIKAHGCTEMNKWVEFLEQIGWHPASELPNEGTECIVYLENAKVYEYIFSKTSIYDGEWYYYGYHDEPQRIIGWCYPPENN